jgi:hypothetical protein
MLSGFKAGVTILDEAQMNSLVSNEDFTLIYDGSIIDSKATSGISENSIADYNHCMRFTLTGVTEISRIELDLDKDNLGSDVIIQIRSGMVPGAGTDGTLLKEVVIPKEFVPDPHGYWSVPVNLSGLVSGGQYWILVKKNGDSTNKCDLIGESSADSSYPAYYRAASSGTWTSGNALHFKIYSGESGEIKHGMYGSGYSVITFANELLSQTCRYLPSADDYTSGVRDVVNYTYNGEYLKKGVKV